MMPLTQIDLLTQRQYVLNAADSKAAKQKGIYAARSPVTDNNCQPTDLVQVGQTSFVVTYSDGSVWLVDARDPTQ